MSTESTEIRDYVNEDEIGKYYTRYTPVPGLDGVSEIQTSRTPFPGSKFAKSEVTVDSIVNACLRKFHLQPSNLSPEQNARKAEADVYIKQYEDGLLTYEETKGKVIQCVFYGH